MGKFSRQKGGRGERALVAYFTMNKIKALRIPLSGAMKGFKHDVEAEINGVTHTFELKCRKDAFKTLYAAYATNKDPDNVWRTADSGHLAAVSTSFTALLYFSSDYYFNDYRCTPSIKSQVVKRLFRLEKLREGANYLVLKDNNKPFLFIRYWL